MLKLQWQTAGAALRRCWCYFSKLIGPKAEEDLNPALLCPAMGLTDSRDAQGLLEIVCKAFFSKALQ
jgi:hypothetical protein